jgi:hypothetical protein
VFPGSADTVVQELEKAREVVADLEADLQAERAKLRAITVERNRGLHDKKGIASELQRTQAVCPYAMSQIPDALTHDGL